MPRRNGPAPKTHSASDSLSDVVTPDCQTGRRETPAQLAPFFEQRGLAIDLLSIRVAAFARAGHPALPLVLRADRTAAEIWLAAPSGQPVSAVDAGDVARLQSALQQLHAQHHPRG